MKEQLSETGAAASATADSGTVAIEIRLSSLQQLFNSFDPSPFHDKELDKEAEDYIVGSADEYPLARPLRLVMLLPAERMAPEDPAIVRQAVANYFTYRGHEAARRLRFQLREGRISLAIGLLFLLACVLIRQLAIGIEGTTLSQIVAEGFLILGWVAMWRPLQISLYDWWPIRHQVRLYAKLVAMPVEIRGEVSAPPDRASTDA
jgi:hypothetical protein